MSSPGRLFIPFSCLLGGLIFLSPVASVQPADAQPTVIRIDSRRPHQTFQGMGCGAIFYEKHITSLGATGKKEAQEKLYDTMFADMRTDFLHLMIRHDHEPQNDNGDPYDPAFKDEWFEYAKATAEICTAAKTRQPEMKLYATLYTPPVWMKTNNAVSAGGKEKATLKPDMELELAEFCWAFSQWMHGRGHTIHYLSIANEPDWPHTQPGYCLTPESHAKLFAKAAQYFTEMEKRRPEVPKPALVGPNVLSAVSCAEKWLSPLLSAAGKDLAVVGAHDYDRRGNRWEVLAKAAAGRPVWLTEWCVNGADKSPGLYHSASQFWLAMTEAFNGGAHAWMAYDWVYPPRQGGEALIHLNWGKDYTLTKIYHGYRQWCLHLQPGMKVLRPELSGPGATGISQAGVKATGFVSADGRQVLLHAAAVQTTDAAVELQFSGVSPDATVQRYLTSQTDDVRLLPPAKLNKGRLSDQLPAGSMGTWLIGYPNERFQNTAETK